MDMQIKYSTFTTFIAQKKQETRRSHIKLKPRNKEVLEPRTDKFSPEPVRKAVKKAAKKTRKAKTPAVLESDSEDEYEDDFAFQAREKIPPRRGGKVSKRGKM